LAPKPLFPATQRDERLIREGMAVTNIAGKMGREGDINQIQ